MQVSKDHILIGKAEYDQLCKDNEQLCKDNEQLCKDNEQLCKDNEQLCKDHEQLRKQVVLLMARVKELEGMLHKDSHNSHKPPGSNEFKKIKNNRIKGEHIQGGQLGSKGTTLKMVEHPDKQIRCKIDGQCSCGTSLSHLPIIRIENRQEFDLTEKLIEVMLIWGNHLKKQQQLDEVVVAALSQQYDIILSKALLDEPPDPSVPNGQRGRKAKNKSKRLIETMQQKKEQTLRFLYHQQVPFDNNLAELDLRMIKVKQKISGCFRSFKGAQMFCRIRSYISTAKKHEYNVLDAIVLALNKQPYFSLALQQPEQ